MPRPLPEPPQRRSPRRLWIAIAVALAIPIILPWITLPRLRSRALLALQSGLGRRVSADAVHLQIFPRPGVELDGVRLAEDPAFGLEDMVVAQDATATVRWLPLLRGRLVFAGIHLDQASINLVRNRAGRWNISALLDRMNPSASTARGAPAAAHASAPRFPYLAWSNSRVNFKLEQTKTRYYLDQVEGSLAREAADWRLQARFQPKRTDRNLSNTGDVRVDGRWAAARGAFHQTPFDLTVILQDSYLAGSSALLVGHDAGVHGIVSAQLHLHGTAGEFQVQGTAQAHALRRWDLLPPPATVACEFAGAYFPAEDRFELTGAGDAGWRHLLLAGQITNLFTRPAADLILRLDHYPAADLLPLAMAFKANLPPGLQAQGEASGVAELRLQPGVSGGSGQFDIAGLALRDGQSELRMRAATLAWDGQRVRLPSSTALVVTGGHGAAPLRLGASAGRQGFELQFEGAAIGEEAAAALARLLGVTSPWPGSLAGSAAVRWTLASPWAAFRQADWSGTASFAVARFQPRDGPALTLHALKIAWAAGQGPAATFTYDLPGPGGGTVAGQVRRAGDAGPSVQFSLSARRLRSTAIWRWLQPPAPNLVTRVFGGSALVPAWIGRLQGTGSVAVNDLDWHGIHAGVSLALAASPQAWQATSLTLALGPGIFHGTGRLAQRQVELAGAVPAAHPLRLAALLQSTPYAGILDGRASGTLLLHRNLGQPGWSGVEAAGSFIVLRGHLTVSQGVLPFDRLEAAYRLRQGRVELHSLIWVADGARWQGKGTANLAGTGVNFDLDLSRRGQLMRLQSPPIE